MLLNLHLLRALAALAVVYFHATSPAGLNLTANIGSHGVDVFFVISGFIMARVGAGSPERFLLRRIVRIVPFYWTATLAVFAAAVLAPHMLRSTRPDVIQLLCSLFFIPRDTSYAGIVPTLVLGWSLNYEMYFYVVFAAALAMAPRSAPIVCASAIAIVFLVIRASGIEHPTVTFYGRPIVLEFVFGICAFYAFASAERHLDWFAHRPGIRAALWIAAILAALSIAIEEAHGAFGLPRIVAAGVPALALVLSALLLERVYGVRVTSGVVFLVGESSYVLYLIHPYVLYGILRAVLPHHDHLSSMTASALVVALMAIAAAVAVAIHIWFEKPLMTALRRRLPASSASEAAGARTAMTTAPA
ncbi:MAG TPA: acyltransferase [Vicinamibacterales bacterium]|jgi:peptidoglycan/LPS O-acetylase OafA/YrhL